MLRKDEKTAVIEANKTHDNDTGSPEVQISRLTRLMTTTQDPLRYRSLSLPEGSPT